MQINFDQADLKPVIRAVMAEMTDIFDQDDRVAYSESEAARMIGVKPHVLRDARLRGEVQAGTVGSVWRSYPCR